MVIARIVAELQLSNQFFCPLLINYWHEIDAEMSLELISLEAAAGRGGILKGIHVTFEGLFPILLFLSDSAVYL